MDQQAFQLMNERIERIELKLDLVLEDKHKEDGEKKAYGKVSHAITGAVAALVSLLTSYLFSKQ